MAAATSAPSAVDSIGLAIVTALVRTKRGTREKGKETRGRRGQKGAERVISRQREPLEGPRGRKSWLLQARARRTARPQPSDL